MGLHIQTRLPWCKKVQNLGLWHGDDLAIIFAQKSISKLSKIYIVNMIVSLCNHLMCSSVSSLHVANAFVSVCVCMCVCMCVCVYVCVCMCVCERERETETGERTAILHKHTLLLVAKNCKKIKFLKIIIILQSKGTMWGVSKLR